MKQIIDKLLNGDQVTFDQFLSFSAQGEDSFLEKKSISKLRSFTDKDRDDFKRVIARTISAFSNTEGGLILIGASDDGGIEQGLPDSEYLERLEWLNHVVSSCVSPSISAFCVKTVFKSDVEILFLIVVREDCNPPRQVILNIKGSDGGKYFARFGSSSRAVSGIAVRDMFLRIQDAQLFPILQLSPNSLNPHTHIGTFDILLRNDSRLPAEKVCVLFNFSDEIISGVGQRGAMQYDRRSGQVRVDLVYPQLESSLIVGERLNLLPFTEVKCVVTIVALNMLRKDFHFKIKYLKNKTFHVIEE